MHRPPILPRVGWELLVIVGLLALGASLRLEAIGTRSLWQDEAFSLDLARRTFPGLLTFLKTNDAHPVGYYALLSVWIRLVGEDLAWMRGLSIVFGLAAVVLTWRLGRAWFSPPIGVGAAGLVALNPFQIFASNELRMYMPLECLALTSTWVLWRAWQEGRRPGWWVGYGLAAAGMAYLSYYAFLLIAAHAVWIVLQRPPRVVLGRAALAAAVAVVAYLPWLSYLGHPLALVSGGLLQVRQPLWATYLPELLAAQTFGGYLFGGVTYHTTRGLGLSLYGLLLYPFLVLILIGARGLGRLNRPARGLVAVSWLVPVAVVVAASLGAGGVAAYAYHLNFLQPFLALLVAGGIAFLRDEVAAASPTLVGLVAVVGVLAVIGPAINNLLGDPTYLSYRYDRAARLVRAVYQPGDVVVYLPEGVQRGFTFYFKPVGKTLGIRVDASTRTREALQPRISDVARALNRDDLRVWLVYSSPLPAGTLEDLVAAIQAAGYRQAIFHDFGGVHVGLLVRPLR
ncbi:MAG: glycosyltransferase family 39 protein [Armatimonadota bacterium]|nr:glycosyltransferase family 39 protein [Armatimonadota bacterium]MDR7496632.1 glycosyltransferase family 39 protein [Armatimonadota bacterium]